MLKLILINLLKKKNKSLNQILVKVQFKHFLKTLNKIENKASTSNTCTSPKKSK